MGRNIDHTQSGNRIIPHRNSQRYNDNHKSQRFFAHTENSPEHTEQEDNHSDHQIVHPDPLHKTMPFQSLRKTQKRKNPDIDRPAIVHNLKSPADNPCNKAENTCQVCGTDSTA